MKEEKIRLLFVCGAEGFELVLDLSIVRLLECPL